jgi:hypothetical protein
MIACSADSELSLRQASKAGMIDYVPGEKDFKLHEDKLNEKQKKDLTDTFLQRLDQVFSKLN